MASVAFYTLGCKLNFAETSAIGRQFLAAGFEKREFSDPADVYVVNTCSVTENANRKCRKIIRQALRQNPRAFVAVVGCYAQLKPREIADIPGVDLVLGASDKFKILDLVEDFAKLDHACVYNSEIGEVHSFVDAFSIGDRTRSFLKIQDGCDYKCSFCTIPLARGRSRSDSIANIVSNAHSIAAQGVREIVLTGVNIGDYGKDQPGTFLDVARALDEVEGIDRIRISSFEPNLLNNEIIEFVAGSKRFLPHFHLPLQSGNDELLGTMRRRYRRDLYSDRVRKIKSLMPHASIGVDVIAGFPGAEAHHFEDSYRYLSELDVSYLHVFTYSERDNTPARSMANPVDMEERHRRSKMLRMLSEKKRRFFYRQHEHSTRSVLFEGEREGGDMFGFTENYIKVIRPYDPGLVNQIVEVRLTEVNPEGWMEMEAMSLPV